MTTGKPLRGAAAILAQQKAEREPSAQPLATSSQESAATLSEQIKAEEARIKLEEIRGQRQLPAELKQREDAVIAKETELAEREKLVSEKESEANTKIAAAEVYFKEKTTKADQIVKASEHRAEVVQLEAEQYAGARRDESVELDAKIESRKKALVILDNQVKEKVDVLIKRVEPWIPKIAVQANKSYKLSEQTKGKEQDYYVDKFNKQDSIKESLERMVTWLKKTFVDG